MDIRKIIFFSVILLTLSALSGCVLTKVASVPMRVGGALISVIPVVGNTMHETIDESADIIDDTPF